MVVYHGGALAAAAHRGEPDVAGGQAAGVDGFQGIFQAAESGIDIVGAEGEFDAARLCPADNVKTRNPVAGIYLQRYPVL